MIPAAQPRTTTRDRRWLIDSLAGALLFGFLLGGLPLLIAVPWLFGGIFSFKFTLFIAMCTPMWMILSGVLAVIARDRSPANLVKRSSLAAFSAGVPIPCALFGLLGYAERGPWVYNRQNLPFTIPFLTVWALIVVNGGAILLALILRTIILSRKQPI
jgi:hypothetical protein